jgi:hypothetical protein
MSFAATLTERAHIYVCPPGQEHWQRITRSPLPCRLTPLSVPQIERAWARWQATVTHQARCLPHPEVQPGRKLVVGGKQAYLIVAVRAISHPAPTGHLVLALQALGESEGDQIPAFPGA